MKNNKKNKKSPPRERSRRGGSVKKDRAWPVLRWFKKAPALPVSRARVNSDFVASWHRLLL